jgi:hypothetical protein
LAITSSCIILFYVFGWGILQYVAWCTLLAYILCSLPELDRTSRIYLGIATTTFCICTFAFGTKLAFAESGLTFACLLATLFSALGFLKEPASLSPSVQQAAGYLISQPDNRRFGSITFGAHLFSLILNFGAILFVGTIIQNGLKLRADTDAKKAHDLHALSLACHRGYTATLAWSPITVSMAVTLGALEGASWYDIAPYCIILMLLFLAISVVFHACAHALAPLEHPAEHTTTQTAKHSSKGVWIVSAIILLIYFLGTLLQWIFETRLLIGVMMICPLVSFLWLFLLARHNRTVFALRHMQSYIVSAFPNYKKEIVLLGCAGFIGKMIYGTLPGHYITETLTAMPLPSWGIVMALPWVLVALGYLGLNPVLSVSLISAALPGPQGMQVSVPALALAYAGGWSLSAMASPISSATMLTAKNAHTQPVRISISNSLYALVCLIGLSAMIYIVK